MSVQVLITWLVAFSLTYLLEAAVYQLPFVESDGCKSRRRRLGDALMINACTHPFVFLILPLLISEQAYLYVVAAELFAFVAEGFLLKRFGYKNPWRLSMTANLVSWLFGSWLLYGVVMLITGLIKSLA